MQAQGLKAHPSRPAAHRIAGTRLYYDDNDVEDGRLSFIVSTPQQQSLDELRAKCGGHHQSRVTDTLDIVHGVVVDVPVDRAAAFVRSLPRTSKAWVDATVNYDRPRPPADVFKSEAGAPPTELAAQDPSVDRSAVNLAPCWSQGFTGKGVNVAVIDSGLWPHADIAKHIVAFKDMADDKTEPYDNYGHGTQVSGIIAGDGTRSHGEVKGAAPDAGIVGVRITTVSEAIAGLQWVMDNKDRLGIRVVNLSLGDTASKSFKNDPWAQACEKAIQAGLVVCVAAGNEGSGNAPGTISTPGIDPRVITIGAMDTRKTLDTRDDRVWESSSKGPTTADGLNKPDLVAPGVDVFGPLAPNSKKDDPSLPHIGRDYVALDGSSQATPFASGIAAILLQANPKLSHDEIKEILTTTARHYLPDPAYAQGAGVIDAGAALAEALRRKNATPA